MNKNKTLNSFLHLLIWFVLFSMPYILLYDQEKEMNRVFGHFWVPLVFYAMIFYINYFVLIDRFLFSKKTVQFVILNAAIIAFFILINELIQDSFFQKIARSPSKETGKVGPPFQMLIYVQTLSSLAPLFFAIAIKSTQRWVKTETEKKQAENIKLQSELQHLHYQLQPHFFFNSLNNIYSLVDISPEEAKTSIHSLSKLMRYMLYETNLELVPLSKEIDFMKKYIDLMKLRLSDKTKVNFSFPSEETGIQIAPLLFISLIENAFKHGVSATKISEIDINMTCENGTVLFVVENNNFPKNTNDKSGSGIGLQNIEKRLELLYPDKFNFKTALKDERFCVILKIETK